MKKLLAILLSVIMVLSLVACGNKTQDETPSNDDQQQNTETETKTIKVGLICIGDENDQGYTYNFMRGKEAADEKLKAELTNNGTINFPTYGLWKIMMKVITPAAILCIFATGLKW